MPNLLLHDVWQVMLEWLQLLIPAIRS